MGKVQVLDRATAELIAAGEVIDRPASVVKELVENALDAGATQITVELQHGGVTYLRVTDNGGGIAPDDIRTAFLRHATSKLHAPEDLERILTMGFRGEALASVAAMCRVEVLSRVPGAAAGMRYRIEGGEEQLCEEAGCPEGTTIVVRDIFYNTPARMKFLKKDVSEGAAAAATVDRLAAIHPQVSFRLLREGKLTLQTPGNNRLSDAVYAVWGREFYRTLVPVKGEGRGVRVSGFVSRPSEGRGNRTMQHFYLNERVIRCRTLAAALEEAYRTRIMKGKYPACVLEVRMPPALCDVNVHPAKLEVRFADEKIVFDAVYYAVRSALDALDPQGVPAARFGEAPGPNAPGAREEMAAAVPPAALPPRPPAPPLTLRGEGEQLTLRQGAMMLGRTLHIPRTDYDVMTGGEAPPPAPPPGPERPPPPAVRETPPAGTLDGPQPAPVPDKPERAGRYDGARLIGEWLSTYVLLECGDQLILIDKHAAHERLRYEELRAGEETARQVLLDPVPLTLPKDEYESVLSHRDLLGRLGFGVEDFGGGSVLLREIPAMLELSDAAPSVSRLASQLAAGGERLSVEALDEAYHMIACKGAIKARDVTAGEELRQLVRLLNEHEQVRFCPHGRPIAVTVTRAQVEKLFGRA